MQEVLVPMVRDEGLMDSAGDRVQRVVGAAMSAWSVSHLTAQRLRRMWKDCEPGAWTMLRIGLLRVIDL